MSTVVGLTADATVEMIEVAKARANHTGTQLASTISDLTEAMQDLVSTTLIAGTNVSLTYNDAAGTITVTSTASGINEGIPLSAYTNGLGTAAANTTAIQSAVNAAKTAKKPLLNDLGAIDVNINARIDMVGDFLKVRFNGLRLVQTVNTAAAIRVGGEGQHIDGLRIYFSGNPNSSHTAANGIEFGNSLLSVFSNIVVQNGARGMYMIQAFPTNGDPASNTVFSCVFQNIRISGYAISGLDMQTYQAGLASSTGNVWDNVYIHNNWFGSNGSPSSWPVIFRGWDESVFNQLNIEWCDPIGDALFLQECRNLLFNSIHFEGITLTGNAALFRAYYDARMVVHNFFSKSTVIANNTGQKSLFRGYSADGNPCSLDVTSVRVRDTTNVGAKPFGLAEVESGTTGGDFEFRRVDTDQFVGPIVVDNTVVVPSQINRYNDVNLRALTVPALTSAANIVAPNVWVDKVRTTDASAVISTTKVTDGTLQFPTTAGTYIIEGVLVYTCPAAGALKLQYNCTGTVTRAKFSTSGIGSNATTSATNSGNYEATAINTDGGWGGIGTNEVSLQFKGTLTVSTSGVFSIQYGQYTSTSPGVIVKAQSTLSYRKVS